LLGLQYKGAFRTAVDSYCCATIDILTPDIWVYLWCKRLNMAENEALWILQFSDDNCGTWCPFNHEWFIVGTSKIVGAHHEENSP